MQALLALSNDSELSACIIKTKLHADMLSNLQRWQTLSPASLNEQTSLAHRQFVESLLNVLHNVASKSARGRSAFRRCDAYNAINKLCKVDKDKVIFHLFLLDIFCYRHSASSFDVKT